MAKLYFRFGVMGSSKTANALMTRFNYEEKGIKVLLVKPSVATRDGDIVWSRIGLSAPAIALAPDDSILPLLTKEHQVVIVDECQFLTAKQVDELRTIVDIYNKPVFCYGLRTDFKTNLFEGSKRLFEMADSIEEVHHICSCGQKAIINARVSNDGNLITDGDQTNCTATYETLCSKCYYERLRKSLH